MSSVVVPPQGQSNGFVYIMGGDTYIATNSSNFIQNGLVDKRWETGYKNDVWRMAGTEWSVKGDPRLRKHHQKIPRIISSLKWEQVTPGSHPPPRTTYDQWIRCLPYFINLNVKRQNTN